MSMLLNPFFFAVPIPTRTAMQVEGAGMPEVNQKYYETAPSVWTAEDGQGYFSYAVDDTTWYLTYNGQTQYGGIGYDPNDPSDSFSWFAMAGSEPVPTVTRIEVPL